MRANSSRKSASTVQLLQDARDRVTMLQQQCEGAEPTGDRDAGIEEQHAKAKCRLSDDIMFREPDQLHGPIHSFSCVRCKYVLFTILISANEATIKVIALISIELPMMN